MKILSIIFVILAILICVETRGGFRGGGRGFGRSRGFGGARGLSSGRSGSGWFSSSWFSGLFGRKAVAPASTSSGTKAGQTFLPKSGTSKSLGKTGDLNGGKISYGNPVKLPSDSSGSSLNSIGTGTKTAGNSVGKPSPGASSGTSGGGSGATWGVIGVHRSASHHNTRSGHSENPHRNSTKQEKKQMV